MLERETSLERCPVGRKLVLDDRRLLKRRINRPAQSSGSLLDLHLYTGDGILHLIHLAGKITTPAVDRVQGRMRGVLAVGHVVQRALQVSHGFSERAALADQGLDQTLFRLGLVIQLGPQLSLGGFRIAQRTFKICDMLLGRTGETEKFLAKAQVVSI